jgi:phospholipid/cholesterol/gamma-HCH transport system ATP-binding protein
LSSIESGLPAEKGVELERKAIIQVKDLTAAYGETIVLRDVNFEVYEREILVILGESGCGKSTLLKHMIGLEPSTSGEVRIDGDLISRQGGGQFQGMLKKIGVLYQGGALFTSMTVAQNVALPIEEYTDLSREAVDSLVKIKLGLVNLLEFGDYFPSQISGGMKKRAGLARAMALNPKILFFDEPSAGLDPISAAEIDHLILQINRSLGTTMVIVTHELQSIFAVAERVVMLGKEAKGIIAEGLPLDLRDHSPDPYVRRFFNRRLEKDATNEKNGSALTDHIRHRE